MTTRRTAGPGRQDDVHGIRGADPRTLSTDAEIPGVDPGTQSGDPETHGIDTRPSRPRGLLFLCVSNRARSQMAEGIARALVARAGTGDRVRVMSAGSRPSLVHPLAVRVLAEIGIDVTGQRSKDVAEIDPVTVDTVITLCAEEECPVFLGDANRLHWEHPDPDGPGGEEEQLARFRAVRDSLRVRIDDWLRDRGIGRAPGADESGPSGPEQRDRSRSREANDG